MQVLIASGTLNSPARERPATRPPFRLGLVQHYWDPDPRRHAGNLREGALLAAQAGARLVCLSELTLSTYFCCQPATGSPVERSEALEGGPTHRFAAGLAAEAGVPVQASLYETAPGADGLGFNTAIVVAPDGRIVLRSRKLHIPVSAGYYEDTYFRPGPADGDAYQVLALDGGRFGFPTCWDQWFPELARAYALSGAEVLVYPTAIGSEPGHPGFDTRPLWQQVMVGNAIANGLFIVAVNRFGAEDGLTFYGSSFIADPYGRVLVQAPRDQPAVLVADLDLDQCRDWLELFPFLRTRRPEAYGLLVEPKRHPDEQRPAG